MLRVLITRATAAPMASMLRAAGAVPVHAPLLDLQPTGEPAPPGRPDIALITSAATAAAVPDLAQVLGGCRVVAVGLKTAAALEQHGVKVHSSWQCCGTALSCPSAKTGSEASRRRSRSCWSHRMTSTGLHSSAPHPATVRLDYTRFG